MKRSVGGKIITTSSENEELITWGNCGFKEHCDFIVIDSFFIRNEGEQDTLMAEVKCY